MKLNIIQYVHPEIQNLYNYLEMEFHPLKLYDSVKSSIEFISNNEELSQYIPALEEIIITRVLKQVMKGLLKVLTKSVINMSLSEKKNSSNGTMSSSKMVVLVEIFLNQKCPHLSVNDTFLK